MKIPILFLSFNDIIQSRNYTSNIGGMMRGRVVLMGGLLWIAVAGSLFADLTVQCQYRAVDAYQQPVAGMNVTLILLFPANPYLPTGGPYVVGTTDSNGRASLSVYSSEPYQMANCSPDTGSIGATIYGGGTTSTNITANPMLLTGSVMIVPRPNATIPLPGGGTADMYAGGNYDKPLVIAQPFNSTETVEGTLSAADLWKQYNGDPTILSGGGMLGSLFTSGYDVWLVRARLVGDDLNLQAADFARAVQFASSYGGYNRNVSVAGYSMGGLVTRIAMAKWPAWGLSYAPPVNLIAALDSPLRGARLSNDLQHAFWNATFDDGTSAHEYNMDSCAAQQMLENACHKTLGCADCLECGDRGWYETFYGGNSFSFCNPHIGICSWQTFPPYFPTSGMKACSGVALLNQPNGGWPAGIKKIGASLGRFYESTGVCYGDAGGLDRTGSGTDGCPAVDAGTFGIGAEWGYLDISLSYDRHFYYEAFNASADSWRYHWVDEIAPGSRQPASVSDVSKWKLGFKILHGHQFRHMGTFIPLSSALDQDPNTGASSLDEYWTNSYSAFHDALPNTPGTWINQRTGSSGSLSLVSWLIKNLDEAFGSSSVPSGCGEAVCVPVQGMYVSHFSGPGCTGTESYYLPYDGFAYNCRTWDGTGQCGMTQHTVTNYSARINGGSCQDLWPSGNTLSQFVTVYRGSAPTSGCSEAACVPSQGMYVSHFSAPGCGGSESYYLPYDGYAYNCRSWDGGGQCGTIQRTITNYSAKINGGPCQDLWPSGNTLSPFVSIYR